jgi:hypothetical protein
MVAGHVDYTVHGWIIIGGLLGGTVPLVAEVVVVVMLFT